MSQTMQSDPGAPGVSEAAGGPDWGGYYRVEARRRRFVPEDDPAEAERCAFAESLLPEGALGRVLELGSGDGHLAGCMARRPRSRVVCVDLVAERAARSGARAGGPAVCARAEALPFREGSFDRVTMVEVLEHVEEVGRALQEVGRVGRGGELVVTVPFEQRIARVICPHCHGEFPVDGHLHSFSERSLAALLRHQEMEPVRMAVYRPEPARRWEGLVPFRWIGAGGRAWLKGALRRLGVLDREPGRYLGAVASLR